MRGLELFRPRPVAATLRAQLLGAVRRSVIFCLLLAAPVVAVYALTPVTFGIGELDYAAPEHGAVAVDEAADREARVVARAERLLERHGCWTGLDTPAEVIPGGVVMMLPHAERPRYFDADALVGKALDHIFAELDDDGAPLVRVFGFCPGSVPA